MRIQMTDLTPPLDSTRLPQDLYCAQQMRRMDRAAIETHGIPGIDLMNRAGAVAYRVLRERWPQVRALTVLTGIGNNGGDGYVVARLARADALAVRVLQLGDAARLRGDAATSCAAYQAAGGVVEPYQGLPRDTDLIVDALLGTGLERAVEGVWAEVIGATNATTLPVLAIDIPSGLHADSGQALGTAVRATATVTFIGLKRGLYTGAGPDCRGDVYFDDLGMPCDIRSGEAVSLRRVDWLSAGQVLRRRPRTSHKGDFGHVLIIGGAPGMSGAARLAGEAALRTGAGWVTIATHPAHAALLNLTRPELMVSGVADPNDLARLIERADVIAVGPGLGRDAWGRALWDAARTIAQPLVVDADALNLLAAMPDKRDDRILTPHPGEAARLLGLSVAEVEQDRLAAIEELCRRYGGVVVLKGAGTLIASQSSAPPDVCSDGNPGMATAGAGDVLTGVIAALWGQGLGPERAASVGVCLHAAAGDQAAEGGERGLVAGDILDALRPVSNGLGGGREDSAG
jgi:ADP-dependent NAD(P)H-hydrate dehydratase / NAD(P)H-hydrate epimerase